jgi:hypothetical protein
MAEPEAELAQRRWFAALMATRRLETECRRLLNALRDADQAWRLACSELAEFEALADALEEQLARQDYEPGRPLEPICLRAISAA